MPGLIDCHVHLLNMWTAKDEATMAADIETELPKRLNDFLTAGVTTVKSVGDSEDDILRVRARLASGELAGPRLLVTGPVVLRARQSPRNHDLRSKPLAPISHDRRD